jgi:hypothetical protein
MPTYALLGAADNTAHDNTAHDNPADVAAANVFKLALFVYVFQMVTTILRLILSDPQYVRDYEEYDVIAISVTTATIFLFIFLYLLIPGIPRRSGVLAENCRRIPPLYNVAFFCFSGALVLRFLLRLRSGFGPIAISPNLVKIFFYSIITMLWRKVKPESKHGTLSALHVLYCVFLITFNSISLAIQLTRYKSAEDDEHSWNINEFAVDLMVRVFEAILALQGLHFCITSSEDIANKPVDYPTLQTLFTFYLYISRVMTTHPTGEPGYHNTITVTISGLFIVFSCVVIYHHYKEISLSKHPFVSIPYIALILLKFASASLSGDDMPWLGWALLDTLLKGSAFLALYLLWLKVAEMKIDNHHRYQIYAVHFTLSLVVLVSNLFVEVQHADHHISHDAEYDSLVVGYLCGLAEECLLLEFVAIIPHPEHNNGEDEHDRRPSTLTRL